MCPFERNPAPMDAVFGGEKEKEGMEGYKPGEGFQEDSRESLVDLNLTDSTELWLFQWPLNELPDFHGKEISLSLVNGGLLGSVQGSSEKSYDVVSCAEQELDATVFVSSSLETKIVGKISRHVSIVHYPDPVELKEQEAEKKSKRQKLQTPSKSFSHRSATPTRSSKLGTSSSSRGHTALTHGGRTKSHLSQPREQSSLRKKRPAREATGSADWSTIVTKSGKLSQ